MKKQQRYIPSAALVVHIILSERNTRIIRVYSNSIVETQHSGVYGFLRLF